MNLFVVLGMKWTLAIQKHIITVSPLLVEEEEMAGRTLTAYLCLQFKFGRLSFVLDDGLLPKPFSIQSSAFLFFFSIKLKAVRSLRNRCFYMYRYIRTFHKLLFSGVCLSRKIKQLYYIFSVSNGNYMGYLKWKIFYEPHYRDSRSFL